MMISFDTLKVMTQTAVILQRFPFLTSYVRLAKAPIWTIFSWPRYSRSNQQLFSKKKNKKIKIKISILPAVIKKA